MKKILIATTALVATAGVAAADITVGGSARIGFVSSETVAVAAVAAVAGAISSADVTAAGALTVPVILVAGATAGADIATLNTARAAAATAAATAATAVANSIAATGASTAGLDTTALAAAAQVADIDEIIASVSGAAAVAAVAAFRNNIVDNRVQFDLRGKIEVGELTFGSHIRMRSTNGVATLNAGQASISSAGLTVFAGNIPGALESMPNVYASTVGYSGGTFQGAVTGGDTMAYSSTGSGAQGIQANYTVGDLTVMVAYQPSTENTQLAASYSNSGLTVAVGAQMSDLAASEVMVATLGYKLGDVTVAVAYGDKNGITHTTGSIAGSFEGVGVKAYVSQKDGAADDAYGVGVSYSLGGGASAGAGFENTFAGASRAEFGISFGF